MAKADPGAKWYQDHLARAKARRAERSLARGRPAGRPGAPPAEHRLRDDPEAFRAYQTDWMRRHHGHRPQIRRPHRLTPVIVIPSAPTGHPLYDEARAALRRWEAAELGSDMDSIAQDLLQTFVLARLEGCDPLEALAGQRRRYNRDRAWLVHGLPMVDGLER